MVEQRLDFQAFAEMETGPSGWKTNLRSSHTHNMKASPFHCKWVHSLSTTVQPTCNGWPHILWSRLLVVFELGGLPVVWWFGRLSSLIWSSHGQVMVKFWSSFGQALERPAGSAVHRLLAILNQRFSLRTNSDSGQPVNLALLLRDCVGQLWL